MMTAVDNTAEALLTSTTILTVGNVVARFSVLGGRMVTGITPSHIYTHIYIHTPMSGITPSHTHTPMSGITPSHIHTHQ